MRAFRDLSGNEIELGRFLGSGGEGAVYSLSSHPRLVAKLYMRTPDDDLGSKLRTMVQLGTEELSTLTAWPKDLALDADSGRIVGFLMQRVDEHDGIHALYGPTNRKKLFPEATWVSLARTARNVAAAFETVHRHGHVIGDVNEGNVVVSRHATARLIDCDSFQITHLGRKYACRVGVPLYTPPELQGQRLDTVVRTPNHDCFGLAVLVFQLLFMGRHPYAGRHRDREVPVATAIHEGLFAFGAEAARQGWEPPPFSLALDDVTPSLAGLFERAFGPASGGGSRPSARDWVAVLDQVEVAMVTCGREPRHAYLNDSCPWCRMEEEGGPSFYVSAPRLTPRVTGAGWTGGPMIGIDLGTTNSFMALLADGVPDIVSNRQDAVMTPSVTSFASTGERLVGQLAMREALTNTKNTVFAVKRLMGRKFDSPEVQAARELMPFQLVAAPNGDVHVQIEGRSYSPPEISSFVLQMLKSAAKDYVGEAVDEAIITVPACFDSAQRQATMDAGLIAGFRAVRLINGPTAAALAILPKQTGKGARMVAVYDLGGGSFDITIVELSRGVLQVRATAGDSCLGGEDFDQRITHWLLGEFQRETGIDLKRDAMALQRLKEAAEKAKCELSSAQQTEIVLPFIVPPSSSTNGPKHIATMLSRRQYEVLTDDLLERTLELCRRCLADAQMSPEQIEEVLLVGGQTRAPKVSKVVRQLFGRKPIRAANADESMAEGAAIQTGILQGEVKDLVLLDVTPHTLGIETKDGTFAAIIDRNSTIPTRRTYPFTAVADNRNRVEVHLLQGENSRAEHNSSFARFELTGLPLSPKGVLRFEVDVEIDANGIVSVQAIDLATGRPHAITIHKGGLGQVEIDRLVEETMQGSALHEWNRNRKDADEPHDDQFDGLIFSTFCSLHAIDGRVTPEQQQRFLGKLYGARRILEARAEKAQSRPGFAWSNADAITNAVSTARRAFEVLAPLFLEVQQLFAQLESRLPDDERLLVSEAIDRVAIFTEGEVDGEVTTWLSQGEVRLRRALRLLESFHRPH